VAGDSTVTQDYLKVVWAACEWGGAGAAPRAAEAAAALQGEETLVAGD